MPPSKRDRIPVTCPRCGHLQLEPRTGYSTFCKECHQHFRIEEVRRLASLPATPPREQRQVRCFKCGTERAVPGTATTTLCKRCGSHVDLADYRITQSVSKNFRTHGRLVIEEEGHLLNSDALVGEAVVKGHFTGKLIVQGTLEINSSANLTGGFTAGRLVIPAGHHFRWPEPLRFEAVDIGGELTGSLQAAGTVWLRATARLFGAVEARNFVVESGAVFVGTARIGDRLLQETSGNAAS
jgi:cytoskeletal protein CcmA (bactofilin family)